MASLRAAPLTFQRFSRAPGVRRPCAKRSDARRLWRPGRPRLRMACLVVIGTALVGGCGENGGEEPSAITLPKVETPSAAVCASTSGDAAERSERPPRPGTYTYETTGRRVLIGETRRAFELPRRTQMIVSRARRVGGQSCFSTQRRLEKALGDTGTFVIRGSDIYLRTARFQAGGYIKTFRPNPAIVTLSGSELSWSGEFRGRTSGRYAVEVTGRKTFTVGGKRVRAVGIEARVSYADDIEGWERSTRWVSQDGNLLLAERVTQEREFGLDRLRLSYRARLMSLDPS